jgi:oxygen-independent coproporphyrinogen-3 oxidase
MTQDTSLWLGKPAPRYTSYPPATQFRPVEAGGGLLHVETLKACRDAVSVYVHIPFCRELCLYCGCHSIITQRAERVTTYLVALHHEIALLRAHLGKKLPLAHLHFGGGSPSTLLPEQFGALMDALRQNFDFLPKAELAVELDPRTTSPALVKRMAAEGINRVSLGVQDFNPQVQELIHRIQPYELVTEVMQNLRAQGITAINLDVMYGLPGQSPATVTETAHKVLTLNPARISLFSYAHVPTMKPYQKKLETAGLPDDLTRLAEESAARRVFVEAGYEQIGIDHFAKPDDPLSRAMQAGQLQRNFQGYTDDPCPIMVGLGASSISDVGSAYVQNEPDLEIYQRRIMAGELPLRRVCSRSADDNLRGAIISELMCNFAVDLEKFTDQPAQFAPALEALAPYVAGSLVKLDGYRIEVDTTYRMAVRAVCTAFDAYYKPESLSSRVA